MVEVRVLPKGTKLWDVLSVSADVEEELKVLHFAEQKLGTSKGQRGPIHTLNHKSL
jgi:hypothetical protein